MARNWEKLVVLSFAVFIVGYAVGNFLRWPTSGPLIEVQPPTVPVGTTNLGDGKYLKYTEKDGKTYVGIVYPSELYQRSEETYRPGIHRSLARMLLWENDKRRWADERREIAKDGSLVYIFRLMTKDEIKEADKVKEEMAKPL